MIDWLNGSPKGGDPIKFKLIHMIYIHNNILFGCLAINRTHSKNESLSISNQLVTTQLHLTLYKSIAVVTKT